MNAKRGSKNEEELNETDDLTDSELPEMGDEAEEPEADEEELEKE